MVTSIYTADVRLNETDTESHKYIILENEEGTLMINKSLFSISFEAGDPVDVEVENKKHIGDVTL